MWIRILHPGNRAALAPARARLILLAVLVLAGWSGLHPSAGLVAMTGLAVAAGTAFIALQRQFNLGFLALVVVAFLVHWELDTGTQVSLNPAFLLALALVALWFLRRLACYDRSTTLPINEPAALEPPASPRSPIRAGLSPAVPGTGPGIPALAFILTATLSLLAGNLPWILVAPARASLPAQAAGWLLCVLPIALLLVAGEQLRDLRWLRRLTWLFLALGSLYLAGLFLPAGNPLASLFVRESAGAMFWTWLPALALGQALFNRDLPLHGRFLLLLLVAAGLYGGWHHGRQEWVSGWLPPLVAVLALLWLRSWRLGLVFTGALVALFLLNAGPLYTRVMSAGQQYSLSSRAAAWPILWDLFTASPILGLGPANYYHYTRLYPLWGWYVKFNSHNNYLDIALQNGLLGLALFLWLALALGRVGWRLRRCIRPDLAPGADSRASPAFDRAYANSALAGLAGLLVSGWMGDWFLGFLYNVGLPGFRASLFAWLFLAGLLSLDANYPNSHDTVRTRP